jgi:hypothetical protein
MMRRARRRHDGLPSRAWEIIIIALAVFTFIALSALGLYFLLSDLMPED